MSKYREYLARRATGLSFVGFYVELLKQSAPWMVVMIISWTLGFLVAEPNRLVAMFALSLPGFMGWIYAQAVMIMAYSRERHTRAGDQHG